MKHNSDFKYDLKVGILAEKHLADILTAKKIEVKHDLQAHKTGNTFIEYEYRGMPSGISTTEADFYAIIVSNEIIYLVETGKLKELCRGYIGTNKDVRGGDIDASKGVLLPLTDLTTKIK